MSTDNLRNELAMLKDYQLRVKYCDVFARFVCVEAEKLDSRQHFYPDRVRKNAEALWDMFAEWVSNAECGVEIYEKKVDEASRRIGG